MGLGKCALSTTEQDSTPVPQFPQLQREAVPSGSSLCCRDPSTGTHCPVLGCSISAQERAPVALILLQLSCGLGTKAAGEVQSEAAEHRCARQAEQKGVMWAESRTSPPWFSSALHVRCIGNVGCFPFQWNKTMKILGRRTTMLVKTLSLRRAVFSDDSLSFQLSLVI